MFLANIAADDVGFIWGKIDRAEVLAQLMLNSKQYMYCMRGRYLQDPLDTAEPWLFPT